MSAAKLLKELRDASEAELRKKIVETSDELMKLRFRKNGGQLENVSQLKELRRSLARINTVLAEKAMPNQSLGLAQSKNEAGGV